MFYVQFQYKCINILLFHSISSRQHFNTHLALLNFIIIYPYKWHTISYFFYPFGLFFFSNSRDKTIYQLSFNFIYKIHIVHITGSQPFIVAVRYPANETDTIKDIRVIHTYIYVCMYVVVKVFTYIHIVTSIRPVCKRQNTQNRRTSGRWYPLKILCAWIFKYTST